MAYPKNIDRTSSEMVTLQSTKGAKLIKSVTKTDLKRQFMDLPIDIHVELFKHLSPTTSACLGLTCKSFYSIHCSMHGKVPLESCDPQFCVLNTETMLCGLLRDFMAPLVEEWCRGTAKFVPVYRLGLREARACRIETNMMLDRSYAQLLAMQADLDRMETAVTALSAGSGIQMPTELLATLNRLSASLFADLEQGMQSRRERGC